jgi:ABC-type Co2+ transport system permease subunit
MKKSLIFFVSIFIFIAPALSWPGSSGTGGTPTGGGPGFNNTLDDSTPVDGGIVTVTALAIGYGVRQAKKRKEEKNNDNGAV